MHVASCVKHTSCPLSTIFATDEIRSKVWNMEKLWHIRHNMEIGNAFNGLKLVVRHSQKVTHFH